MGGKVRGKRLLITLTDAEHRAIRRAARAEGLPVATYIRRAAVLAAQLAPEGG